jgi:hypothetical protein
MKKGMLWCLLALLVVVGILVAGCGKSGSPAATVNTGPGIVHTGGQWPSQMPPDVPKFNYGTIGAAVAIPGNSVAVGIENATPDAFVKYQSDLKNAGWTIGMNVQLANSFMINATKGKSRISVNLDNSGGKGYKGMITYSEGQ